MVRIWGLALSKNEKALRVSNRGMIRSLHMLKDQSGCYAEKRPKEDEDRRRGTSWRPLQCCKCGHHLAQTREVTERKVRSRLTGCGV